MTSKPEVRMRRIYDDAEEDDGLRVLVDRRWPRGVKKTEADLDEWCKDVAPSTKLRKWYDHDPAKFDEFSRRYRAELEESERTAAMQHLRDISRGQRLTLLTGTKDLDISQAAVLASLLHA